MNHRDDDLQKYVALMEASNHPETVLAELPAEHRELAPILSIAAALRELPDPEIHPAAAHAQDREVLMAIRLQASRAALGPSSNGHRPASDRYLRTLPRLKISRPLGLLGGLAAVLVLFIAFLLAARLASPGGLARDRVTLTDVAGVVEVSSENKVAWQTASSGDTLGEGQRIRTGPGSTATLVFFDGTRTRLAAGTDLTLVMLEGEGESLRVELNQRQGRTRHAVVPLQGDEALYLVRTPGGSAIVHGTVFDVLVAEDGTAEFNVTEGQVAVNAAGREVLVGPGQMTTAAANTPPAAPTVMSQPEPSLSFTPDEVATSGCGDPFSLIGTLANMATDPEDEAIDVSLGYNVIEGAEYVESVLPIPSGWPLIAAGASEDFFINVAMNANWDGAPDGTEVKVRVFVANEGNRPEHHMTQLTATITRLCGVTATPTPTTVITSTVTVTPTATLTSTATLTPTGTAAPTMTVTPTGMPTSTATVTPPVTPTAPITTVCTGANPHPQGTALANQYGVPYEEIMGWFCSGYGFGEIVHAYDLSLDSGVPVADIFAMRASGMGWGQIGQQLGTSPGGGPPDGGASTPESNEPPDGSGQPNDPGPPDWAGPPDKPDKPEKPDKPDKPDNPGNGGGPP
jgi:hypothetical protein